MNCLHMFILAVGLLGWCGSGCKSKSSSHDRHPSRSTHQQREPAVQDSSTDERDIDSEDDSTEAFPDLEDSDILCHDYQPKPTTKILPPAVIIGTRKGGTRALVEFLNMHSLIRRSKPEIHFYDKHFDKGVDWYISQMPEVTQGQVPIEKTPGYFHTPISPPRLRQTKNDTKLLIIMRDPVKRLISDYNQFYHNNVGKGNDYPPIEQFLLNSAGEINENYPPLQRSIYHKHMEKWLEYFPLDQFYIVDGDKFIKEPWVELEQVERFLGIPPELGRDNFYFNQTKGYFCGKEMIENVNMEWSCSRNKCLSKSKGRKPPKLADNILRQIYEFMEPYNQLFFELVNRTDFDWTMQETE